MNTKSIFALFIVITMFGIGLKAQSKKFNNPIIGDDVVFEGKNGLVAVEAEYFNAFWGNIELNKGDIITVTAKIGTDGEEFTRGRWAGIIFASVGKGKQVQEAPTTYSFIK